METTYKNVLLQKNSSKFWLHTQIMYRNILVAFLKIHGQILAIENLKNRLIFALFYFSYSFLAIYSQQKNDVQPY